MTGSEHTDDIKDAINRHFVQFVHCPTCKGTGATICPMCQGRKWKKELGGYSMILCPHCKGKGEVGACRHCNGNKKVPLFDPDGKLAKKTSMASKLPVANRYA